jgi:hypothetical protein
VVKGELFFPGRGFLMDQVEMLFMRRGFTMDSFIHELGIWQQGINKLAVSETGPGRDSDRSAYWLIARLADLFELCTGKEAGRTYDGSRVGDEAVSGPFGIFVRAVNKQIPKDFRLRGIDNLICLFVSARKLSRSTARTR